MFVVNHVPAYPSYRKPEGTNGKAGTGAGNRKHWVPLFEKYRVPVVLEHHDHTFKRTKPLLDGLAHDNGVLYLGDGSWGQLRTPQTPEKLSLPGGQQPRLSPVAAPHPGRGALPPRARRTRPGHGRVPQRPAENRRGLGIGVRRRLIGSALFQRRQSLTLQIREPFETACSWTEDCRAMSSMKCRLACFLLFLAPAAADAQQRPLEFRLTFDRSVSAQPFTGRVYVMLFKQDVKELRSGPNWFQPDPFFAQDVKDWQPGQPLVLDGKALGFR